MIDFLLRTDNGPLLGVNRTPQSMRAFSVCYMEAATVCTSGAVYPVVFGEGALAA